jgi:hypothetical protein
VPLGAATLPSTSSTCSLVTAILRFPDVFVGAP